MVHSALYMTVLAAFKKANWAFTEVEGKEVIRAGFEAHHARVDLHLQVFESLAAVSVVSESPRRSQSPLHRDRVTELAMRVNQTLTVGNFEMDWEAGRLIFRVTNLFPTPQGDLSIIQGLIHTTVGEMDRMAPLEAILLHSDGPTLAALNIPELLRRDDLIPEIVPPESFPP